jgi:glycosyltransferase involved in cell wall biosynthesis
LEPFGLVTLEALACGTPVVAVCEGGPREILVEGVTGRLVPRDEANFADALDALLADPKSAAQMGAHGRDDVRSNWTWEASGMIAAQHLEQIRADHGGTVFAGRAEL